MASIKLYFDTRTKRKDNTFPLKVSIHHNDSRIIINLKIYLFLNQFEKDEIVSHPDKKFLNSVITQRLAEINRLLYNLEINGELKFLSAKELKRKIENPNMFGGNIAYPYLVQTHFLKYIGEKKKKNTKDVYQHTYNKIAEFTNIESLTFEDMNLIWLKSFDKFLDASSSINTKAIHFRNIRAVFNNAIDEDFVSQNIYPFRKFKIPKEATIKRSLSVKELILLRDYPCEAYLEKYRDIFMLIFYLIGINIIDLLHLKEINNGKIEYRRAKTGRLYSVKVLPEAQGIFDKYRGQQFLLDVMDNYLNYKDFYKRMNMNLKRIGSVVIGKHGAKTIKPLFPSLTTYYARHTWATIAASLEIPKETIAAALGHGATTVTDIYIDFDVKKVDEANRKVLTHVRETVI